MDQILNPDEIPGNGKAPVPARPSARLALRPPDPPAQPAASSFDLRTAAATLRRHPGLLAAGALLGLGVAAWVALVRPARWQANAVVRIHDARRAVSGGLATDEPGSPTGRVVDPVLSQLQVLLSRNVAGAVVDSFPILRVRLRGVGPAALTGLRVADSATGDSLVLAFGPGGVTARSRRAAVEAVYGAAVTLGGVRFAVPSRPRAERASLVVLPRDAGIGALLGGLHVAPRENTDVVDVRYTGDDAGVVRAVLGRTLDVFIGASAAASRETSEIRRRFLQSQLQDAEGALAAAREALAGFRARQVTYSARDRLAAAQSGLGGIQVRREELDAERRVYRGFLARLQGEGGPSPEVIGALLASPGVVANPVVNQLAAQLARYQAERDSATAGRWGSAAGSPDVQRLDSLIAGSRRKLVGAVQSLVDAIDARIASLDGLAGRSAAAFQQLSTSEESEDRLNADVDAARKTVADLRDDYQRARVAEAVHSSDIEIVDGAGPASRAGLGANRTLAFGLLLGLLLGGLAAVLAEHLNTAIRGEEELTRTIAVAGPVVIPRAVPRRAWRREAPTRFLTNGAGTSVTGELVTLGEPQGPAAEAYRALRTKLLFADPVAGPRFLSVTSALPLEGKTTVAANLGVVFAEQGLRVLLVDCDLRRPRLHSLFHVARAPGITGLLEGSARPEEAVCATAIPGLSVLPAGPPTRHPAERLGAPALGNVMRWLKGQYDLVLADTAPLLAATDAAIVSAVADGVLLVVRAGRAARGPVHLAVRQLEEVRAPVIAAILNDPDAEIPRMGGEYYYANYGQEAVGSTEE